jgi:hypothetical protein
MRRGRWRPYRFVRKTLALSPGPNQIEVVAYNVANFVDRQVPELTYDAWKMRQVPQMKIVGSNFPLVSRTALLPAVTGGPALAVPATPTHVVISPAPVRESASNAAAAIIELQAGSQVRLIETSGGWALVARDGKRIGYVESGSIVQLH